MTYKFKLKSGDVVRLFHNKLWTDPSKNYYGTMAWKDSTNSDVYKELKADVHMDAEYRLFFIYNDEKIYTSDFLALTPEELVGKVNNHEDVGSEELVYTLIKYGIDSLLVEQPKEPMDGVRVGNVIFGLASHSFDKDTAGWDIVDFRFEETDMFKLNDNYKVMLVPNSDEHRELYGSDFMYISDLVSLMAKRDDLYKLKVNDSCKRKRITPEMIEDVLEGGWCEADAHRGYSVFTSDFGNGALHIERIDEMGVFESDDDAAEQAERDGIRIIKDMKFSEGHCANYIDTPENRELLKDLVVED